ncbi:MAG: Crp/Fnr family transcriptional regulator [Bacteroidota bacterium]
MTRKVDLKDRIRMLVSQIDILTKEEIELIVDKTIVDTFKKGTILLREGEVRNRCFMVVQGCVREYILVDGEEKSVAFYTEGEKFTPYTQEGYTTPSKYFWECTEDCILTISDKDFEQELRMLLPRLDTIFQHMAIQKMDEEKEKWSRFISSSPEERYVDLLENRPGLLNRVPHHQIASYLGMKPESLSRIRKRIFEKRKQVK